jgi:hypothetical protein
VFSEPLANLPGSSTDKLDRLAELISLRLLNAEMKLVLREIERLDNDFPRKAAKNAKQRALFLCVLGGFAWVIRLMVVLV